MRIVPSGRSSVNGGARCLFVYRKVGAVAVTVRRATSSDRSADEAPRMQRHQRMDETARQCTR